MIEIVTVGLEVLVPVGELDDDLDLGIDGARRREDEIARDLIHELQTEFGPALRCLWRRCRSRTWCC